MSDSDVSGEEGSLCIDTKGGNPDPSKKKGGGVKGNKGRRRSGKRGKALVQAESDGPPKPGDLVWAKVMGFNFWPAKLFDAAGDDMVPEWLKQPPKPSYMLVRFFGTYDMQWVSPSSVDTYARGLKKRYQTKSKSKAFQKAMLEVTDYIEKSVVPEGLTVSPPYPMSEEDGKKVGKRRREKRGNGQDKEVAEEVADEVGDSTVPKEDGAEDGMEVEDSKRSASSNAPASPTAEPASKRPRMMEDCNNNKDGGDTGNRLVTPEVEAFTCAPLSSFSSSKDGNQEPAHSEAGKESDNQSKDAASPDDAPPPPQPITSEGT